MSSVTSYSSEASQEKSDDLSQEEICDGFLKESSEVCQESLTNAVLTKMTLSESKSNHAETDEGFGKMEPRERVLQQHEAASASSVPYSGNSDNSAQDCEETKGEILLFLFYNAEIHNYNNNILI